jgi:hypothetical protein
MSRVRRLGELYLRLQDQSQDGRSLRRVEPVDSHGLVPSKVPKGYASFSVDLLCHKDLLEPLPLLLSEQLRFTGVQFSQQPVCINLCCISRILAQEASGKRGRYQCGQSMLAAGAHSWYQRDEGTLGAVFAPRRLLVLM